MQYKRIMKQLAVVILSGALAAGGTVTAFADETGLPAAMSENSTADGQEEITPEETSETTAQETEESVPEETETPTPEPAEETTPEVTEEPVPEPTEEPTPEVTEEPAEESTPEVTEEPAEESTPEVTEETAERSTPEVTEEPAEESAPEVTEETTQEETPEPTADAAPEPASETELNQEKETAAQAEDGKTDAAADQSKVQSTNDSKSEDKTALSISTGLSVSGSKGNITLVLTITNGTFAADGKDPVSIIKNIPDGVSVSAAGITQNSIIYRITGTAAQYTKNDLQMVIPAGFIRNTAGQIVNSDTEVTGHDLYWKAYGSMEIDIRSHASTITNEAFAASQNLVNNEVDYDELTFVHRDLEVQCFSEKTEIYEYPEDDARTVGKASENTKVYVIASIQGGWYYCESGDVRGFVKKSAVKALGKKQKAETLKTARCVIDKSENEAFDYIRITAAQTEVNARPMITKKKINIYEENNGKSRVVGTLSKNGVVYWLKGAENGWCFVESGDVRGFVKTENLYSVKVSDKKIEKNGIEKYAAAETEVDPEENKAYYYTLKSVKTGSMESIVRDAIVKYTSTFLGNPYVWGGTDPVNGADCSGLMQTVYSTFGYSLPRTSIEQAYAGKQITLDSLNKGDLIIFADDGDIYHVAMYAGDEKTIEAAGETTGIVNRSSDQPNEVWGVSILDGADLDLTQIELPKPDYEYERNTKSELTV